MSSCEPRILVVGDDSLQHQKLKDVLEKNGYQIISSQSLSQTLDFFEEKNDFLLLDSSKIKNLKYFLSSQNKMSSLGHVITGIAHEIRSPLSVVNISLNNLKMLLNREQNKEKTQKVIKAIQTASHKIELVIKRVLAFTRTSESNQALHSINQALEEIMSLISVTLRKKDIKVEKSLAKDLPLYHLDIYRFQEMILNLIINAIDAMEHMKNGKKIEITSFLEEDKILVSISDSGPGVPSLIEKKVLETFFTTKENNIGIGLSIGNKIITNHRGSLKIHKSKWDGAKFTIELPLEKGQSK